MAPRCAPALRRPTSAAAADGGAAEPPAPTPAQQQAAVQAQYFDEGEVQALRDSITPEVEAKLARVASLIPALSPDSRVLDAGAGEGALIPHLQARGVRDVLAVDVSRPMLEALQRRVQTAGSLGNEPGVRTWLGDVAELPAYQVGGGWARRAGLGCGHRGVIGACRAGLPLTYGRGREPPRSTRPPAPTALPASPPPSSGPRSLRSHPRGRAPLTSPSSTPCLETWPTRTTPSPARASCCAPAGAPGAHACTPARPCLPLQPARPRL